MQKPLYFSFSLSLSLSPVERTLEEKQDLLPDLSVLVCESARHLLEERLRLDHLRHELADDGIGLLTDGLPAVPKSVGHRTNHDVQVRLEGDSQSVHE